MQIAEPGLVYDMPEHVYHADPYGDSLSSSEAKEILKSPAHLHHYRTAPREHKPVFDFGSAVHTLVLGTGWPLHICDYGSWRSKDAQAEAEQARAESKIPLLRKDHDIVQAVAAAVRDHPIAGPLFSGEGSAEVSAFGEDESGVKLRGRFDWITDDGWICDLKTARSADPADFGRTAVQLGYDIQAAHYLHTYWQATDVPAKGFRHVLVEKEPPYLVSVVELDDEAMTIGHSKLERAIARYKEATETNTWPGYPATIHPVQLPMWAVYAEEGIEEEMEVQP